MAKKKPNKQGKQRKQPSNAKKQPQKQSAGASQKAAAIPKPASTGPSIGERISGFVKNPFVRFFALFLLFMVLFYYVFYINLYEDRLENFFTKTNAMIGSALINIFGYGTSTDGALIQGDFVMNVKRGCDAIEPIGLASSIILAYPTVFKRKLPGLLVGVGVLLIINLIRIVTLYMTGIHAPKMFEVMHLEVWQFIFIVLAVLYSILWIRWDGKKLAEERTALK